MNFNELSLTKLEDVTVDSITLLHWNSIFAFIKLSVRIRVHAATVFVQMYDVTFFILY